MSERNPMFPGKGDGVTDDTTAIQAYLDGNPMSEQAPWHGLTGLIGYLSLRLESIAHGDGGEAHEEIEDIRDMLTVLRDAVKTRRHNYRSQLPTSWTTVDGHGPTEPAHIRIEELTWLLGSEPKEKSRG